MRLRAYLRERYRALFAYAGEILTIIGILYLIPPLLLLFYPHELSQLGGFLLAGLPLIVAGLAFWKLFIPKEAPSLTVQESYVVVVLVWGIAILTGTIPFLINSGLDFSQALFESTSGWTGTGLTVVDVANASHLMLFYRSFMQLAGGTGFAIIAVSAIAGMPGAGLSAAEGRTDQLAPHVRQSASIVMRIYAGYIVFGILALWAAGMDLFDAVNHAFTALSTAGFSTRVESIGYWDNPVIEGIIVVLMLLGATNFLIAYTVLRRKLRAAARSGEIRMMFLVLPVSIVLVLAVATSSLYPTLEKGLRVAVFEVTSAATTTGFSTVNTAGLPPFVWMVLLVLMLMGGGTGSTAGGIKQFRIYIVYKSVIWEIKKAFMPAHMVNEPAIWQGEKRQLLNDRQVRLMAAFIGMYIGVFLTGSLVMVAFGYDIDESLFEFASTLGGVGMSVGVTAPDMPRVVMWMQSIGMLLGRLEFFPVILGVLKISFDAKTLLSLPRDRDEATYERQRERSH